MNQPRTILQKSAVDRSFDQKSQRVTYFRPRSKQLQPRESWRFSFETPCAETPGFLEASKPRNYWIAADVAKLRLADFSRPFPAVPSAELGAKEYSFGRVWVRGRGLCRVNLSVSGRIRRRGRNRSPSMWKETLEVTRRCEWFPECASTSLNKARDLAWPWSN